MRVSNEELGDYRITVSKVLDFGKKYSEDWKTALKFNPNIKNAIDFYEYVKSLKFLGDRGEEIITRALYTLDPKWTYNRDCDDKTVAIGNFAEANKIPWRVKVVGEKDRPHHIYPELKLGNIWYIFDATFPDRCAFGKKLYKEKFVEIYYPT